MFLCPSRELNELVLYILAVAAERSGILLHAYCFMSNHLHLVLTDPRGTLPAFEQYLAERPPVPDPEEPPLPVPSA